MTTSNLPKLYFTLLILLGFTKAVSAHEFWIDAISATGPTEKNIAAHIRVGQNFVGESYYYIPDAITRATITDSKGSYNLKRTIGDTPVFDQKVRTPGLHILAYQKKAEQLTYRDPGKFAGFISHAGMEWVLDENKKRGLPEVGITEKYVRYAKALVARGGATGMDKKLGLKFEIVALKNPFLLKLDGNENQLPVQVWWQDKPFANGLLTIFEKSGDNVVKSQIRSDQNGKVNVPLKPGRQYLLNMVTMTPLDKKTGAVWKSHWASLTFSTSQ